MNAFNLYYECVEAIDENWSKVSLEWKLAFTSLKKLIMKLDV